MITLENLPETGLLILSVYWDDYKDSYQNDARRSLKESIPKIDIDNNLQIDLRPVQFSLIKVITGGINRAVGAQYQYSFKNLNPDRYKTLHNQIIKKRGQSKWWSREDIMIASNVMGI